MSKNSAGEEELRTGEGLLGGSCITKNVTGSRCSGGTVCSVDTRGSLECFKVTVAPCNRSTM